MASHIVPELSLLAWRQPSLIRQFSRGICMNMKRLLENCDWFPKILDLPDLCGGRNRSFQALRLFER